jgi:hypothetical protein
VVAPICELAHGRRWNSAVLVGRDGAVVGTYHKAFPVFGCPDAGGDCDFFAGEQGISPGWAGVGVFPLDFGRISMLTCFDINFPELWHEAYALGSELVVWPSAMNSSSDPSAPSYARLHQYYVAGVGTPGTVYEPTGVAMGTTVPNASLPLLKLTTIDLDASWAHWDNNGKKVHTLLHENPGVELAVPGPPFYYLKATQPGVSVRALFAKYKIESARNYILRSRVGLNKIRAAGSCVLPGHGDPMCGGGGGGVKSDDGEARLTFEPTWSSLSTRPFPLCSDLVRLVRLKSDDSNSESEVPSRPALDPKTGKLLFIDRAVVRYESPGFTLEVHPPQKLGAVSGDFTYLSVHVR